MFYRLKTDLPTFKAGDLFYIDRNGSLCHKDTDIVAYHYSTLEKFPDMLERFWEPVEEGYKRWRACPSNPYYYVDDEGDIYFRIEGNCLRSNDKNYAIGNYFQTKAEAQACADYLKALAVVRDDANGFMPDWDDSSQEKFTVYYSVELGIFGAYSTEGNVHNGVFGLPYFETQHEAHASIDVHTKEWRTIFGIKDNDEEE